MRGSIIVTYDELTDGLGGSAFQVIVNGLIRNYHYTDTTNLYTTDINVGDTFAFLFDFPVGTKQFTFNFTRRCYTTDDTDGDMGIIDELVTGYTTTTTSTSLKIPLTTNFTASVRPDAYDFEYRLDFTISNVGPLPTATPTPTPTATPTATPTPTPTATPTPTPTPTVTPTPTPIPPLSSFNLYIQEGGFGYTGYTQYSSDSGVTFTSNLTLGGPKGTPPNWYGFAVDKTTKYQVACTDTNKTYTYSSDSGTTWTQYYVDGLIYSNIPIKPKLSKTGSIMAMIAGPSSTLYVTENYGSTWRTSSAGGLNNTNWDMSLDGKYMIIGQQPAAGSGLYYSSNSGTTWTTASVTGTWVNTAISDNGQTMAASTSTGIVGYYTSQNGGTSWAEPTWNGGYTKPNATNTPCDISPSGQYVIINTGTYIWRSTDYGVSFTRLDPFGTTGSGRGVLFIESSGIVFAFRNRPSSSSNFEIWRSNNFGSTWTMTYTKNNISIQGFDYSYIY
jgi:hypothetical protein